MSGKITNKLPLGLAGCLFVVIGAIVAVGLIVAFSYRDKERDESASITCSRWPVLYDNRYLEPFGEASVLYSHPDLHRVPLSDFKQDVLRGEELLRELAESHHGSLRYFRHPFLHTGRELELRHDFEGFLADHGYRVAPVTVDNSEWIFARAMDEALDRNDDELANRLEQAYVGYMVDMVDYYEGQSCTLFGRLIPQILLLHANALNGRALGTLLARLAELGYEFATLDQALEDGAYSSPDTYTGPAGITWLHRWAITRDVDRSMFAGEPTTPVWVQELAGISE